MITINLNFRATTVEALDVTIITTYYNDKVPVTSGKQKQWSQLKVIDCPLVVALTTPDPWIVSGDYSIGTSNTVIKSGVQNVGKPIEV